MSGVVPVLPRFRFFDKPGGNVLDSGFVTVYAAGTTTKVNTYQDKALGSLNTNPIQLDADGECLIYTDGAVELKFLLEDKHGATVTGWPVDNIPSNGSGNFLQTGTGAVTRAMQAKLRENLPSVLDFIPVSLHAGIKARTDVTDLTSYIAAAYAAAPVCYWPAGKYNVTQVNLTSIFGAGIVGDSDNAGPTFSTGATEIIITANNAPGIRVWGPVRLENFYVAYSRQQTSLETSSRAVEFNNISGASIKDIRAYYGYVNFGIPQSAFTSGVNFVFDCDFVNLKSYNASGVHYDFRTFSGGSTNCRLGPLYVNGGGSLDFVTAGQAADYAFRFASCFNFSISALSIDGLRINTTGVEAVNGQYNINDIRFEACTFLGDTARVIEQNGSTNDMKVQGLSLQNTRWLAATPSSFFIYNTRATKSRLIADLTWLKSDCALGASGQRRVLFNSADLSTDPAARIYIGPVNDDGAQLTDTTAWTDSTAVQRDMPVFTFNGRKVKEFLQGGRTGARPMVEYLTALPTDGARNQGDQIVLTLTSPDKVPDKYVVTAAGTPGTFRPRGGVVGMNNTANRPALTASDVGWMYMDTTLDADGKPIWWNGTVWVDATGATV